MLALSAVAFHLGFAVVSPHFAFFGLELRLHLFLRDFSRSELPAEFFLMVSQPVFDASLCL